MIIYESEIEQIALELLRDENDYNVLYGPELAEDVNPVGGVRMGVLQYSHTKEFDNENDGEKLCLTER
jgi:hypothetical protein